MSERFFRLALSILIGITSSTLLSSCGKSGNSNQGPTLQELARPSSDSEIHWAKGQVNGKAFVATHAYLAKDAQDPTGTLARIYIVDTPTEENCPTTFTRYASLSVPLQNYVNTYRIAVGFNDPSKLPAFYDGTGTSPVIAFPLPAPGVAYQLLQKEDGQLWGWVYIALDTASNNYLIGDFTVRNCLQ